MSTPKDKPKPIVLTCRINAEELRKVKRDARKRKRTMSDHMRGRLGLQIRAEQ